MEVAFQFDGSDLHDGLSQLSDRVSRRIQREVLKEAAEPMRKRMSVKAPRDPSTPLDLKDEMTISNARGEDRQEVAIAVGPSKRAFHGSFQEYGTVHHPAQPFARPAFDGGAPISLRAIVAGLWRELAARGIRRQTVRAPTTVQAGPGSGLL